MFEHNYVKNLLKNKHIIKSKSIGEKINEIVIYKEKETDYTWNYLFLDDLKENTIKFSIKSTFRETIAPKWPLELIKSIKDNLKKFYINIKNGDVICIEKFKNQCSLAGFIFIHDKDKNMYNLVPLVEKELYYLELMGSKKLLDLLYKNKVIWKDIYRESIINDLNLNSFYSPDIEFTPDINGTYELTLGSDDLKFIIFNFLDKLLNKKEITLFGEGIEVKLCLNRKFGVEVEGDNKYMVFITKKLLNCLKNNNLINQNLNLPNTENLKITLKKTFLRNNLGEIVG